MQGILFGRSRSPSLSAIDTANTTFDVRSTGLFFRLPRFRPEGTKIFSGIACASTAVEASLPDWTCKNGLACVDKLIQLDFCCSSGYSGS